MSVVDEIKKNKELLDQGAITQEEYDKIKKDLLGLEENTVVEKKSNKTLIGIVVLVVLVIAGGIGYKLYKDSLPILTIKPMVVEVGDKVTLDISNFFDEKNSKNITVDDLTIDSELMSDDYKYNPDTKTVTNKDKKYLGVGMYEVTIKSNKVSGSTSIEVKDTTAPTITVTQKSVECELGEEMDFKSYFKVKDFSKYELKVNSKKVDFNTEGTYKVSAKATDEYGNESKATLKVVVKETPIPYYAGIYKSGYGMKIRTTPSINASAVGSTAPNYRIIIQEVVKGDNHSYWGRISNGYVCIQDSDNTYMSYTGGLQAHLQQYGDTISFGVKACGYTEEQANAGIGGAFPNNGSNYTMLCSGEWLIY